MNNIDLRQFQRLGRLSAIACRYEDLAILAERLIEDFPEYYPLFAETEFKFDGRAPSNTRNRNPLLRKLNIGADGLKTGHTEEAGYGLGRVRQYRATGG